MKTSTGKVAMNFISFLFKGIRFGTSAIWFLKKNALPDAARSHEPFASVFVAQHSNVRPALRTLVVPC